MASQRRESVESLRETLLSNWPGETPNECLEQAEKASSTTPDVQKKRCPHCHSTRVILKPSWWEIKSKIDTKYKCNDNSCLEHFNEPLPPLEEIGMGGYPPRWWGSAAGGLEGDR